jgi:hypothetical protein
MLAVGEELFETRFGVRDGIRPGDPDSIEAERAGLRGQRRLEVFRIQKSRSA